MGQEGMRGGGGKMTHIDFQLRIIRNLSYVFSPID